MQMEQNERRKKKGKAKKKKRRKHGGDEESDEDDIQPQHQVSTVVEMPEVFLSMVSTLLLFQR